MTSCRPGGPDCGAQGVNISNIGEISLRQRNGGEIPEVVVLHHDIHLIINRYIYI